MEIFQVVFWPRKFARHFQSVMDQMINSLQGVAVFLDDIIISGRTEEEHWANFERVIGAMADLGFRIQMEKCSWMQPKCDYLGFEISAEGRVPSSSAVKAIRALPRPSSTDEVKAFLGKIGYYSAFIPNMANKAAPLYAMLKKNAHYLWNSACETSFQTLKQAIVDAACLTNYEYDPSKELVLATDASPYGTGAVLSQIENGQGKPLAFVSKTLTPAQRRYSQIDREGLGVIFGVTKFHKFLYGRKFILQLDNKPLTAIFSPDKHIPAMAAQRLARWALKLRTYNYEVQFRPTGQHSNADGLSRLPAGPDKEFDHQEAMEDEEIVHLIEAQMFQSPLDISEVSRETLKDKILSEVRDRTESGNWPTRLRKEEEFLRPYWNLKDRLMVHADAVTISGESGVRLVVPKTLTTKVLKLLHTGHFGVIKMKRTLRQYVRWSGTNGEVEAFCKSCIPCCENARDPPKQFQSWPETAEVWSRIHIDYAGPFRGKMWLIIVDSRSRFPYLGMLNVVKTTAKDTIEVLKFVFSIEGLCKTVVSDNGSQFVAAEFQEFLTSHGIKHITTSVYSPSSNGLAERFVATFKQHMTEVLGNDGDGSQASNAELWHAARQILFMYRIMPHSELDGRCPAEVLHGRKPRNILSLLNSSLAEGRKDDKPSYGKVKFPVETSVFYRNYGKGRKWLPGTVTQVNGMNIRVVKSDFGFFVKRHCNQLQRRFVDSEEQSKPPDTDSVTTSAGPTGSGARRLSPIVGHGRYPQRTRCPPRRLGFDE